MPPRVPEEKRVAAVRMSLSGTSQRQIAMALDLNVATVNRIICAFRDEGRIGDAARNCVRKTTAEEDAALVLAAETNPFMTAGQVRDAVGLDVSEELVRKRLLEEGLKNRSAAQKPLLSDTAKAKRLDFAQAHLHWTADDWHNVVFTDESTFCTQWDQKRQVYRPDLTRFVSSYYEYLVSLCLFLFSQIYSCEPFLVIVNLRYVCGVNCRNFKLTYCSPLL